MDVPQLTELLGGTRHADTAGKADETALVATTRAQAKQQQEEEEVWQQKEREAGAQPHTVDDLPDGAQEEQLEPEFPFRDLQDNLFDHRHERIRLTRSEKRLGKQRYIPGASRRA